MNLKAPIGRLRLVAILEGISYLLLGITMPLKYMLEIPEPNFIVGMAHGWLFILYIALCLQSIKIQKWNWKISLLILAASLIPFATFFADNILFKPTESKILY
jgi:integral membrane protein